MTHLISSMAFLLTPGTRKRLPQSGFVQTGLWEVAKRIGITQPLFVLEQGGPVQDDGHPERSQGGYAGNWARKPPSLAVALNCGTGSSFLKALVKAFDRLHMLSPTRADDILLLLP